MSQVEIVIREAGPEDSLAIATLLHALDWFEQTRNGTLSQTQMSIAERIECCRREQTHTILVAQRALEGVVGYTAVHWYPSLTRGNEGYVSELFVHPSHTGQGIGGRLLDTLNVHAHQRGCIRLLLLNRRIRESYRRGFYAKHGWEEHSDGVFFTRTLSATRV